MLKLRWFRHLKVVFVAGLVFLVAGVVCGALWLNQRGFEGEWGERIAEEMARRGIHADFSSVRFSPTRGVIAREVVVYFDESRERVFARIPVLRIEVDRAKALRGELLYRRFLLRDAELTIPVGPDGQHLLRFEQLNGKASIDRQGRLLLEEARGRLGEMEFDLKVELDEFDLARLAEQREETDPTKRDQFTRFVFQELGEWSFPDSAPPRLELDVSGSLRRPESIRTSFSLSASELTRRDYTMQKVLFAGELHGRLLTVDHLSFSDGPGSITVQADFDLEDQAGRCELDSSIKAGRLLRQAFDLHYLDDLVMVQAPRVVASGTFGLDQDRVLQLGLIGQLNLGSFRFLGSPFESLKTGFSWQNGDVYLRDLAVTHAQGKLEGQILMKDDQVRYQGTSTLPVELYKPFIREGSGLEKMIARCSFSSESSVLLEAKGSLMRSDLKQWVAHGQATAENFLYNGVPLTRATADFNITPLEATYTDVRGLFDYSLYPMRQRHGGPRTAEVRADRIHYDRPDKLVRLTNLRGTVWPGPMLRLFTPRVADYLERTYSLPRPPDLAASGVIDLRKPRTRTDLTTRCRANSATGYQFLGKPLQLDGLACRIRTRHQRNDISELTFQAFGGSAAGSITVNKAPDQPASYRGGLRWDDLVLAHIGRTYGFEKATKGTITGRFDFSGVAGNTRALNGRGVIGLRNGHLFFVPVFGPLSTPISTVLGNRKFSHEEARDASSTFVIRNGVVHTNDFLTSTPSTTFTGEGNVDLHTRRINMTVRMNARGLLGLLTLPLRPFSGLFQFHGSGPVSKPVWGKAPFTSPPLGKDDPIFRKPPRARIVPER